MNQVTNREANSLNDFKIIFPNTFRFRNSVTRNSLTDMRVTRKRDWPGNITESMLTARWEKLHAHKLRLR